MGNGTKDKQEAGKEDDKRSVGDSEADEPRLNDPVYLRTRYLWKRFKTGKLTADEREELNGGLTENPESKKIKELFDGKNIS